MTRPAEFPRAPSVAGRIALASALALALAAPARAQTLTPPDTTAGCQWQAECSAPGATLRMAELGRAGSGRGAKVDVVPRVAGLAAGVPFTLWMRRLGQGPQWVATGWALDAVGTVACADRARYAELAATAGTGWCPAPLDSLRLTIGGAMEGEPFAFAVSTPDGRTSAYDVVVPRPVTASAPGCGTLDLQLIAPDARTVRILGTGFPPSAAIATESVRGRDRATGQVTSDSAGRFVAIVTLNGRGGDASYTARTERCAVTLPYRWGKAAY